MKCPSCQAENREGAKFCDACGGKLELVCGQCGHLGAAGTKEHHKKRVPIHVELVPILEEVLKAPRLLGEERVFLVRDENGVRRPGTDTIDNPWPRACEVLGFFPDPPGRPRFHDLRHTFTINAAESGVTEEIIDMIEGHSGRKTSVHRRYRGRESQRLLRDAIDQVTFDHGDTRIQVGGIPYLVKNGDCVATESRGKRKRSCGNMT